MAASTAGGGGGRFRELLRKYGKVALGVHFSVSAASITGLYVAIKNNVDVEAMLEKVGMGAASSSSEQQSPQIATDGGELVLTGSSSDVSQQQEQEKKCYKNRTTELAASSGGALALAFLCNKALFPIRVPITIALTPPIARFLRARNIIKNAV